MKPRSAHTTTQPLQLREKTAVSSVKWVQPVKRSRLEDLTKNMAVAAALLVALTALRSGALPGSASMTEAVLTAVTGDTLLDDQLGRLTFVSTIFPEATLVFGEGHADASLLQPVSGGSVIHAWSEAEPYMAWQPDERMVYSALSGEVAGVYHGEGEELIVHVAREDGLSCLCGNMETALVSTGDFVEAGALLGYLQEGAACCFEVRQNGYSIDPSRLITE